MISSPRYARSASWMLLWAFISALHRLAIWNAIAIGNQRSNCRRMLEDFEANLSWDTYPEAPTRPKFALLVAIQEHKKPFPTNPSLGSNFVSGSPGSSNMGLRQNVPCSFYFLQVRQSWPPWFCLPSPPFLAPFLFVSCWQGIPPACYTSFLPVHVHIRKSGLCGMSMFTCAYM